MEKKKQEKKEGKNTRLVSLQVNNSWYLGKEITASYHKYISLVYFQNQVIFKHVWPI